MSAPTALETVPTSLPATPANMAQVQGYVSESLAPSTRRAYRTALAAFRARAEGVTEPTEPMFP